LRQNPSDHSRHEIGPDARTKAAGAYAQQLRRGRRMVQGGYCRTLSDIFVHVISANVATLRECE
jgi:hypothetical protein